MIRCMLRYAMLRGREAFLEGESSERTHYCMHYYAPSTPHEWMNDESMNEWMTRYERLLSWYVSASETTTNWQLVSDNDWFYYSMQMRLELFSLDCVQISYASNTILAKSKLCSQWTACSSCNLSLVKRFGKNSRHREYTFYVYSPARHLPETTVGLLFTC